ncbi:dihydroxyacetone kinase phosphoryl donor subunit DhaM [Sporolituus thermophilus]|uniref:phosphoenolpyruvate--glycerone phosphotransferase n=1 Tax=Sporolituus thermophilus DSM 23256 TaxID=1123285 RepID=A0A1G7L992_9FIRM|nr:dihydroxyacetone kinase phosphoryl donor subunit DhaM [Sporolituus thermophilus]SDF46015.1 dihydroxyacetone kinase, phosphotransfer subunit [Sporolituus thermophilus DSM 23256]
MVGIVIVSHSAKVAEGIAELARQMAGPSLSIIAAGGLANGEIGTDAVKIVDAVKAAQTGEGVAVLVDLGSAVLSSQTALELLDEQFKANVRIIDAPILEGAIAAAVQAAIGGTIDEVAATAEGARAMRKL